MRGSWAGRWRGCGAHSARKRSPGEIRACGGLRRQWGQRKRTEISLLGLENLALRQVQVLLQPLAPRLQRRLFGRGHWVDRGSAHCRQSQGVGNAQRRGKRGAGKWKAGDEKQRNENEQDPAGLVTDIPAVLDFRNVSVKLGERTLPFPPLSDGFSSPTPPVASAWVLSFRQTLCGKTHVQLEDTECRAHPSIRRERVAVGAPSLAQPRAPPSAIGGSCALLRSPPTGCQSRNLSGVRVRTAFS